MTLSDWILDITLVLIVFRQMRPRRLTWHAIAVPVGIVTWAACTYLRSIPTTGSDLQLVAACVAAGAILGIVGGATTHLWTVEGHTHFKAGMISATVWVLSMSARLGFIIWITHSSGAEALGRFSVAHHLTSGNVWQDALVLLALSEVLTRTGVIVMRAVRISGPGRRCTAAAVPA